METGIERRTIPIIGRNQRSYLWVKRWIDIVVSFGLILLLFPLFALIAMCIKLDSRGPIFFKQTRIGQNRRRAQRRRYSGTIAASPSEKRMGVDRRGKNSAGRPFEFYKFRTMRANTDPSLHRRFVERFIRDQIDADPGQKNSNAMQFKMGNDPRVTRVGRVLRRTSLDELPQLFNVLKGEMSLVGPRPPIPYEVEHYQEWHKERLHILPGITGLWQVQGRSRVTFDEMVRMDLDYITHMSLALDLKIILLTLWAVLSGKGAA